MKMHCDMFEKKVEAEAEDKLKIIDDLIEQPKNGKAVKIVGVAGPMTTVLACLGCGIAVAMGFSTLGVGSLVGAAVTATVLAVTEVDKHRKKTEAKVVQEITKDEVSSVMKCIIKEVSKELSRIFEYQLFRLKDERQVEVVAHYAVYLMFDLQEGDKFDRNTLLRKVLEGKKGKTKELVTRDGKKNWRIPDVFRKPGLRKATLIKTPENSKRIKFEYLKKCDGTCDVEVYGYRGPMLEMKSAKSDGNCSGTVENSEGCTKSNGHCNTRAHCSCESTDNNTGNDGTYFVASDIDQDFTATCLEPSNYQPFHCLVQCPNVLEHFASNLDKERTLANYICQLYNRQVNQTIKPVYRPHSPRKVPILSKTDLRACDFSRVDFSNSHLEGCDLSKCTVLFGNFEGATLSRSKFSETYLSHCNLKCVKAQRCEWMKVKVLYSCLDGGDISKSVNTVGGNDLEGTPFDNVRIGNSACKYSTLFCSLINIYSIKTPLHLHVCEKMAPCALGTH